MHLANLPELGVMIGVTWEIASDGLAVAVSGGGRAPGRRAAMRVFVGDDR
jgi:hypothetical protein